MTMGDDRKTRILHVIGSFSGGGMESNLLNFLHKVDYSRFEHFVFVGHDGGELREEFHDLPITIVGLKYSPRRYFYTLPYGLYFCLAKGIDILHGHNYWSYRFCYFISIITRIPLITADYGLGTWKQERHRSSEAKIFRRAKCNVAVSKAILVKNQSLLEPEADLQKKFKLVYPIIRDINSEVLQIKHTKTLRRSLGIPDDYPVLTIIGRVIKLKGHRFAIDAVQRLNRQGVKVSLLIVGRLDEPAIIKSEDIEKEFIIYKNFYDRLEEIWAVTDVFLIPSISEGTPLVLVEYFALGKPVIASNIGGNRELIKHGLNGLLFEKCDVDDLVRKIEQAISHANLEAIGANARRFYLDNLSPSIVAKKIEEAYANSVSCSQTKYP